MSRKSERGNVALMDRSGKRFREDVGDIVCGRYVNDTNVVGGDMFSNKMMPDVDVLGSGMELVIMGEGDGGHIVTIDLSGAINVEA